MKEILVGLDGSSASITALEWAIGLATDTGAHVRGIHVKHVPTVMLENPYGGASLQPFLDDLEKVARQRAADVVAGTGVPFEFVVRDGDPVSELNAASTEFHADLLVISGHGHRGLDRLLLGSVATHLLHTSPVPVTLVR